MDCLMATAVVLDSKKDYVVLKGSCAGRGVGGVPEKLEEIVGTGVV